MSRTRTTPGRRVESNVVDIGEHEFELGEILPDLRVVCEAYDESNGQNAVLVCHGLTGNQHVAGYSIESGVSGQARAWWSDIVGPGKAVDTSDYYVICVNVSGSCYDTSDLANEGPDGRPWSTDLPPVIVHDWTRAQCRLLDHLGVGHLHTVVGGSVDGINALDWAVQFPDDVERLAVIASAARLDSQCLGIDTVARRAITSGLSWNGGDYYGKERPSPDAGLDPARQLGHLMYFSKDSVEREFGQRSASCGEHGDAFPSNPVASFFPYREVESYLDYQVEKFAKRFDANAYLYLTRTMDDFGLSEGYESDTTALAALEDEAFLVSFTGDWHFTAEQSKSLAGAFRRGDVPIAHCVVESDHGHDASLVEPEKISPPPADFVDEGVTDHAVTDAIPDGDKPDEDEDSAPVCSSLFSR